MKTDRIVIWKFLLNSLRVIKSAKLNCRCTNSVKGISEERLASAIALERGFDGSVRRLPPPLL